jgi:hypothetical protein
MRMTELELSGVPEPDGQRPAGADRLGSAAASGGIQEETTILGVSCLTLREGLNTEAPRPAIRNRREVRSHGDVYR